MTLESSRHQPRLPVFCSRRWDRGCCFRTVAIGSAAWWRRSDPWARPAMFPLRAAPDAAKEIPHDETRVLTITAIVAGAAPAAAQQQPAPASRDQGNGNWDPRRSPSQPPSADDRRSERGGSGARENARASSAGASRNASPHTDAIPQCNSGVSWTGADAWPQRAPSLGGAARA